MQSQTLETTSEISFEEEVWVVLKKIKKRMRYVVEGEVVEYKITASPYSSAIAAPLPVEEKEIIGVLVKWGAIEIVNPDRTPDIAETSLSKGMNMFIAIYSLKILEPKFGDLYQEYEKLSARKSHIIVGNDVSETDFTPLKWDSKKLDVQWQGEPENLSRYWAVMRFLNVMSSIKWTKEIELTPSDLAESYNELFLQEAKEKNKQYLGHRAPDEAARAADRALHQLYVILGVNNPENFPIGRRGSVRKGKWRWVQSGRVAIKKERA